MGCADSRPLRRGVPVPDTSVSEGRSRVADGGSLSVAVSTGLKLGTGARCFLAPVLGAVSSAPVGGVLHGLVDISVLCRGPSAGQKQGGETQA